MTAFPYRRIRVAAGAAGLAAGLVMAGGGVSAAGDPGGRPLTAVLTGAAEVNAQGVPNQGDLDGTGTARITVNPGQNVVCWDIEVSGIATPTRGHIHQAPAGVNGPIVVEFFEVGDGPVLQGCTTPTGTTAQEILRDPAAFYVNVHNADFPAGALRGQLSR
jgi:hypothetical protein